MAQTIQSVALTIGQSHITATADNEGGLSLAFDVEGDFLTTGGRVTHKPNVPASIKPVGTTRKDLRDYAYGYFIPKTPAGLLISIHCYYLNNGTAQVTLNAYKRTEFKDVYEGSRILRMEKAK